MFTRFVVAMLGVDLKRVTIVSLTAAVGILYAYIHQVNAQLSTAKLVYLHPQRIKKLAHRKETGPVRIVTRYIERPNGERETFIDETHGVVVETDISSEESKPISIAETLTPPRTDRYLLTFGVNRLSSDLQGKAILVGYGFKNRLDIQAGIIRRDETSPWILATFRF